MSVIDPRERFSGAAAGYARPRPSYPAAIVDGILSAAGLGPGDPVADVGCGTGILTRLLAERGTDVVGIDPNEPMLAEARAAGGRARYQRGEAEATDLPDASVALVTVAQAFHWFDLDRTLAEFHRVLKPGGHVAALWNLRAASPFHDDYEALLRRFCQEYRVLEGWEECLDRLRNHPLTASPREIEAPNSQLFDLEGLRGRSWSSSYVIHGVVDREGFDAGLRDLFETHAHAGVLEFPYRTVALVFAIRPEPSRLDS
jgi:SAM-dependent methyltransferase